MREVAVVIVSYRSEEEATATAIAVASDPEVARVFIVDNSSSEQSGAFSSIRGREQISVIPTRSNVGYAAGNNVGIRAAWAEGHPYVMVLNPDISLMPGSIRALVDMLSEATTQIVSPALEEVDCMGRREILTAPGFDLALGRGVLHAPDSKRFIRTFFGAAFVSRVETFERFGLLDDDLFLYCEEIEYVERLRRCGEPNSFHIASGVVAQHRRGGSVSPTGYGVGARSAVAFEEAARSSIIYARKYRRSRTWWWILTRLALSASLIAVRPRASVAVARGLLRGLTARLSPQSAAIAADV